MPCRDGIPACRLRSFGAAASRPASKLLRCLSACGRPADDREKALLAPFPGAVRPDVMAGTWHPTVSDGTGRDRFVARKALALLNGAGWRIRNGTMQKDGTLLRFEIMVPDKATERLALIYADSAQQLGIGITAYGVLSHGLLTGAYAGSGDEVAHLPRFHGENLATTLALVERLRTIADARGVTVAQLAIAWVLAQGDEIVALVGASRPGRIADTVAAADLALTDADLAAIDEAVPAGAVAGERYAPPQMAMLDSDR